MPIHDWTRVNAGLFHHFHQHWMVAICDALNAGVLPPDFYALSEQSTASLVPDILALEMGPGPRRRHDRNGGIAVATAPPRTRFVREATEENICAAKASRIAIHHQLGDVVAIIEIVSPGNKSSQAALRRFVEKALEFLYQGVHLLVIDLFPPSKRNPQGIHKAIWDEIRDEPFELPPDKPLTLVSYAANLLKTAYIEPVAVGDVLPDMPVFIDPGTYVLTPLETTYQSTWATCPQPLKRAVLEGMPMDRADS